jgi:type I restriction enzyme S subunit
MLKPYPEYKDSGLQWLGTIPAHWEVKRAKYLFREIDERSSTGAEELLSVSHITGVTPRSQKNVTMFKAESYVGHKICRPNDLVINTMWAWMGTLGVAKQAGLVSPSYAVYRPLNSTGSASEYIDHLLRTKHYVNEHICRSTGIRSSRLRLYPEKFLGIPIVCPPYSEQERMVSYLRKQHHLIRNYISAQQRLINLLDEQKQAIIQQAVTRGLDPNVPLKDSGVEWIGEIPEHWDVLLNQRIFKEKMRPYSGSPEIQLSLSQRDGLIPTRDMKERSLQTSTYRNWKVVLPGDLVLNRFKAHLGVFFCATLRGIVTFHYGVFQPRVKLVTRYFELLFHTEPYRTIFAGRSNGMTVGLQNLSNQNFYSVRVLLPPLHEQEMIVSFIEKERQLVLEIGRINRQIDLIREYRARLIADVVTGKLDVRGVSLPELDKTEIDDLDLLDPEEGNDD